MDYQVKYDRITRSKLRRRKKVGRVLNATTSFFNAWFSYICVLVTAAAFACFYLQSFFFYVLALLLSIPVISYNVTSHTFRRLETSVAFSCTSCSRGGGCDLTVTVDNPCIFPVSCFELTLYLDSPFYGGMEPVTHSFQLKAKKKNILRFPVKFDKYGIYNATVTSVRAFDHLHLFSFDKKPSTVTGITVMPEGGPSSEEFEFLKDEGFDEFTDNERRGNHSSNVNDIREYIPGDRLSRIHWKLTEKLDKLIVKENEATSSNEFTVLLELYQPSEEECLRSYVESGGKDDGLYHTLDNAIERAYSISLRLIEEGEQFTFMFYDGRDDFTSSRIGSREALDDILTRAFYCGSYDRKDLALTVYTAAGLDRGTLIHVG
ncbi:MAG: DUF58 domain-containing protein [Lachnospiraceae bacterium]|nr:DUF58 domain-containing protein [Lachnospiraceae bacterium]